MANTTGKNGRAHVLEISNRASIQKAGLESLSGLTGRLDNHESGLNANAHGISNIAGLQTVLDGKSPTAHTHSIADIIDLQIALDGKANSFTGYTGSVVMITGVDFTNSTTTTKTIQVNNGIITSII